MSLQRYVSMLLPLSSSMVCLPWSLQKLQCKDENKCSLNLQSKIAKTCGWTVREAPPSVIASPSWSEPAFGAGSRRCGGRAVKEKVAVSGVETSEGPERKRTNHRGGFAAQPPLFPPPQDEVVASVTLRPEQML